MGKTGKTKSMGKIGKIGAYIKKRFRKPNPAKEAEKARLGNEFEVGSAAKIQETQQHILQGTNDRVELYKDLSYVLRGIFTLGYFLQSYCQVMSLQAKDVAVKDDISLKFEKPGGSSPKKILSCVLDNMVISVKFLVRIWFYPPAIAAATQKDIVEGKNLTAKKAGAIVVGTITSLALFGVMQGALKTYITDQSHMALRMGSKAMTALFVVTMASIFVSMMELVFSYAQKKHIFPAVGKLHRALLKTRKNSGKTPEQIAAIKDPDFKGKTDIITSMTVGMTMTLGFTALSAYFKSKEDFFTKVLGSKMAFNSVMAVLGILIAYGLAMKVIKPLAQTKISDRLFAKETVTVELPVKIAARPGDGADEERYEFKNFTYDIEKTRSGKKLLTALATTGAVAVAGAIFGFEGYFKNSSLVKDKVPAEIWTTVLHFVAAFACAIALALLYQSIFTSHSVDGMIERVGEGNGDAKKSYDKTRSNARTNKIIGASLMGIALLMIAPLGFMASQLEELSVKHIAQNPIIFAVMAVLGAIFTVTMLSGLNLHTKGKALEKAMDEGKLYKVLAEAHLEEGMTNWRNGKSPVTEQLVAPEEVLGQKPNSEAEPNIPPNATTNPENMTLTEVGYVVDPSKEVDPVSTSLANSTVGTRVVNTDQSIQPGSGGG